MDRHHAEKVGIVHLVGYGREEVGERGRKQKLPLRERDGMRERKSTG